MNAGTNHMQRIHGLDLLRAAAILMVLTAHYPKAGSGLLIRLLNLGWAGVDLFFVLSGYLIAGQLLKPLADGNTVSLREFYLSRLMRTLACDDEPDVACPVLAHCEQIDDPTLVAVARLKGHRTSEIAAILGYQIADEIIHRDNLVLL